MSDPVTRRRFLASAGAVLGVGPLVAACGGGGPTTASACAGYGDLTGADLAAREALGYVDKSPKPAEICASCRLYDLPEGDSPCGGCQLFAGPVLAAGYCNSWAAMRTS